MRRRPAPDRSIGPAGRRRDAALASKMAASRRLKTPPPPINKHGRLTLIPIRWSFAYGFYVYRWRRAAFGVGPSCIAKMSADLRFPCGPRDIRRRIASDAPPADDRGIRRTSPGWPKT